MDSVNADGRAEKKPRLETVADGHTARGQDAGTMSIGQMSVLLFLLQRIILTFASLNVPGGKRDFLSVMVNNYVKWDSGLYISIAQQGYTSAQSTAFFPVFPLCLRFVHFISGLNYNVCGVVLSGLAFIFALYYVGRLVERHFGINVARTTLVLLTFFPMSFFFASVYTESLFLAITAAAVYLSESGRFWISGILVTLATLTRNTGILLELILLFNYLDIKEMGFAFWEKSWWRKLDANVLSLLFAPLGLLLYMVWLKVHTGDFLAFLHAQHFWERMFMPIWETYYHTFLYLLSPPSWGSHIVVPEFACITLVFISIGIGVRFASSNKRQLGWLLYLVVTVWLAATEPSKWPGVNLDYLYSFPRFTLMMFPAFAYGATVLKRPWFLYPVVVISAVLLMKFSQMFLQGQWVA